MVLGKMMLRIQPSRHGEACGPNAEIHKQLSFLGFHFKPSPSDTHPRESPSAETLLLMARGQGKV